MKKIIQYGITSIVALFGGIYGIIYSITYHPEKVENARLVCPQSKPILEERQKIKVLNWNVQYMASKNYIFFYDLEDFKGKDVRPSKEDIAKTISEVARVINEENPDILLFQEVNEGSSTTYHDDQLSSLRELISKEYDCYADAFYFKSKYLPQYYYGSVGMKLVVLSKYKIDSASRFSLTEVPSDPIRQNFGFKRAVLEAEFPLKKGGKFVAMSTHLDAFSKGYDTMERQVQEVNEILNGLNQKKLPWIIAGDFNLLPAGWDKNQLHPDHRYLYNEPSEIQLLLKNYDTPVSMQELNGKDQSKYYTHIPNHPESKAPDRTIDYYFHSKEIKVLKYRVRSEDTTKISDHLPMILEMEINSKND